MKKFMKTNVAMVSLAAILTAQSALANTVVSALNYVPVSTSYQPLNEGDIVRQSFGGMTVAQKFEVAGQHVFGAGWPSMQGLFAHRYDSNRRGFEGFCHQWAPAAHDIGLQNLINQTGGVRCGSATLSVPELRELATALYTPSFIRDIGAQPHRTQQIRLIRNEMGMDRIPALQFHNEFHNSFRANQGVGFDIGPETEVWNYPAYRIESTMQLVDARSFNEIPLPPSVYTGHMKAEYEVFYSTLSQLASRNDTWGGGDMDLPVDVTQATIDRAKQLEASLKNSVDSSVQVYRVRSVVHHAGVSSFGSGSQVSKTKTFEYVLVSRGNGSFIDGAWISKISKMPGISHYLSSEDGRPQRIWVAKPLESLAPVSVLQRFQQYADRPDLMENDLQKPALQALITMLQRCERLE